MIIGLDFALQRLKVNGNAVEDLVEVAKDSCGMLDYHVVNKSTKINRLSKSQVGFELDWARSDQVKSCWLLSILLRWQRIFVVFTAILDHIHKICL